MTKKIDRLDDWITASKAAELLSEKMGFPIEPEYLAKIAASKRQPIKTKSLGYHKLYNREDLERVVVRRRSTVRSKKGTE